MDLYKLELMLAGLAILGAAVIPRALASRPLSLPIIYVLVGMGFFLLPCPSTRPTRSPRARAPSG